MSFKEQFEADIRKQYDDAKDEEVFFRWIWEKILESYRNGIKAGQNGTVVKRDGKSRGTFGKSHNPSL